MSKLKIFTVLGTRPEIIRLSLIIKKFDIFFDHTLIHTGQNPDYELNKIFFDDLKIRKPDYFLNAHKNSPIKTIAKIIIEVDKIIKKNKPDAFFILGDTNSSMSAYSAKRNKIPIFHYEAGNRCFDQRVPEEINRKIIDHIADINLTYSDIARNYLINENFAVDRIIKIGSPMYEVIKNIKVKINKSNILKKLKLKKLSYILISIHREENLDYQNNFNIIIDSINELSKKRKIILSLHPRTKKKLSETKLIINKNVDLLKPFSFSDYLTLQKNSFCVISDSGTINEESSILDFDAINIRDNHERPESNEESVTILSGINKDKIIECYELINKNKRNNNKLKKSIVSEYKIDNVSDKIIKIVQSYTNYVNKHVWKK
tara:strand:- start:9794 stop:10918 length:1125 start_codon:yes stop_codon:yes gene_type:complete